MQTAYLHKKCQRRLQERFPWSQKYSTRFGSKLLPSSGEAANPTGTAFTSKNNEEEHKS